MANIFRGPDFVARREFPPVLGVTAFAASSLLATVLATSGIIPLPLSAENACCAQAIQQRPGLNADTSADLPSTLRSAVPAPPVVSSPYAIPLKAQWQPSDTSFGTPKALTQDGFQSVPALQLAPIGPYNSWLPADTSSDMPSTLRTIPAAPFVPSLTLSAITRLWQPADTTADMPPTLRAIAPPIVPAPGIGPSRPWWQPADASSGTAKTLTQDAQLPRFVAPQFAPSSTPAAGWLNGDSTHGQPITLQAIIPPPPVVVAPHFPPPRFWWQPADTSRGADKELTQDAQAPVFAAPQFASSLAPLASWLPADTSADMPSVLRTIAPPIVPGPTSWPLNTWWLPADASASMSPVLRSIAAPFIPTLAIAPLNVQWVLADTTADMPPTLRAPILPPPVGLVAAHFVSPRVWWQPLDTSLREPQTLQPATYQNLVVDPLYVGAGTLRNFTGAGTLRNFTATEHAMTTLSSKTVTEQKTVTFDYTIDNPALPLTFLALVQTLSVGNDTLAGDALIMGSAQVNGVKVLMLATVGLLNCDYRLICYVRAADGQVHGKDVTLPIRANAAA